MGRLVDQAQAATAERDAYRVHQLLGRKVIDAQVNAPDTASGEAPVQVLVLFQDALDGGVEVVAGDDQQVGYRRASQSLGGEAETLRLDPQAFGLRW